MPKKKRKGRSPRRRPNSASTQLKLAPPAPLSPEPVDLPAGAQEPLLRLEFSPKATSEDIERAIRYWNPDSEGGWAELVSALGNPSKVAGDLAQVCEAYLIHCLCSACTSPMRATSRSDAVSMAGNDLRRASRTYLCRECRRAQEQRQAEEARARQEQAQVLEQTKKASLERFFQHASAEPNRHNRRAGELDVNMVCVLVAMLDHTRVTPILPARQTLATGWRWPEPSLDDHILRRLHENQWITVDRSASPEEFTFDEDGEMSAFYLGYVPYRLATSPEETRQDMMAMLLAHSKDKNLAHLKHQIIHMEARSLFRYLDTLLVDRYQYPPIPESKKPALHEHLFDGLEDYTYGQMLCFLWRTADTAAAWKERKQLTDAHASSATVTILSGKIANARECKASIPEYDPPRSHIDPPALAAARSLLRELEERIALGFVCELHDEPLPCAPCLGTLYAGDENAEEIREHYALLGESGIELRPDLATKKKISPAR